MGVFGEGHAGGRGGAGPQIAGVQAGLQGKDQVEGDQRVADRGGVEAKTGQGGAGQRQGRQGGAALRVGVRHQQGPDHHGHSGPEQGASQPEAGVEREIRQPGQPAVKDRVRLGQKGHQDQGAAQRKGPGPAKAPEGRAGGEGGRKVAQVAGGAPRDGADQGKGGHEGRGQGHGGQAGHRDGGGGAEDQDGEGQGLHMVRHGQDRRDHDQNRQRAGRGREGGRDCRDGEQGEREAGALAPEQHVRQQDQQDKRRKMPFARRGGVRARGGVGVQPPAVPL